MKQQERVVSEVARGAVVGYWASRMLRSQQKFVRSDLENKRVTIQQREMGFFASNLGKCRRRCRRRRRTLLPPLLGLARPAELRRTVRSPLPPMPMIDKTR